MSRLVMENVNNCSCIVCVTLYRINVYSGYHKYYDKRHKRDED